MAWIEHATSPLPRECSATELHGPFRRKQHSLLRSVVHVLVPALRMSWLERVKGIEPSS